MAELSYSDMQRAVQDATRDLRDAVNRLSQQQGRIEGQIGTLRQEVDGMRRQINATNIQVSNLINHPAISLSEHMSWRQLGNSVHSIEVRLNAIQNYLREVSQYLELLSDQNRAQQL